MTFCQIRNALIVGTSVFVLAACSSSTSAVDSTQSKTSKNTQKSEQTENANGTKDAAEAKEAAKDDGLGKVIREPGAVANRGVYVKLVVNRNAITNFDINRRAAFLKLRRVPGNKQKLAEKEMIEQVLKLQEAQRRNVLASEAQVDQSFASFAKRNRATPEQLSRELGRLGVGADHFKKYMRAEMSWQRAVNGRFRAQTVRLSEQDAILKLRESGEKKPELNEYSFQQVVFVVPKSKQNSKSIMNQRKREAQAFRQRFTTCDETVAKAKELRDVSVINKTRILEPELPDRWRSDVAALGGKGSTKVKETEKGVEFLAICGTRLVNDDRAAQISSQSNQYDSFTTKSTEVSEEYMKQLKASATIIYK